MNDTHPLFWSVTDVDKSNPVFIAIQNLDIDGFSPVKIKRPLRKPSRISPYAYHNERNRDLSISSLANRLQKIHFDKEDNSNSLK